MAVEHSLITSFPEILKRGRSEAARMLSVAKSNIRLQAEYGGGVAENLLINSDNLDAICSLINPGNLDEYISYAGKVDLIYVDPPYNSNADYMVKQKITSPNGDLMFSQVAYTDKWKSGTAEYLQALCCRLILMRELLSDEGSIFVHVDSHANSYVRILLDEIFGFKCFRNEIVWCYRQGGRSENMFSPKHDTIYWYSKNPNKWIFNADAIRVPYEGTGGYQKSGKGVTINGRVYKPNEKGKIPEDWWDIPALPPMSSERVGFATQKPEMLLERIVSACSNENSIVADFYCGSGTTLSVAGRLGRKWIGVDSGTPAIRLTMQRLLEQDSSSFKLYDCREENQKIVRVKTNILSVGGEETLVTVSLSDFNCEDLSLHKSVDKAFMDKVKLAPINALLSTCYVDVDYDGKIFRPLNVNLLKNNVILHDKGSRIELKVSACIDRRICVLITDIFGRCQKSIVSK